VYQINGIAKQYRTKVSKLFEDDENFAQESLHLLQAVLILDKSDENFVRADVFCPQGKFI